MDKKPDKETLNLLKDKLKEIRNKFNVEKFILFGSRARGDHVSESDIDLIVVSKDFKNIHFLDRLKQAYYGWDKIQGLDILCYTSEELDSRKTQGEL